MPRFSLQGAALVAMLSLLAACSSGGTIPTPAPAPSASTSVTLPVGSAATPATLPAASGAVATVSLSSASAPAGATIAVTYSATAPSGVAPLIAKKTALTGATVLAYYTFTPSVNIPLNSFPAFTMTYPSSTLPPGTLIREAFLDAGTQSPVYQLDVAFGTNGATLTGTASAPALLAGKTYVFVFYYFASLATPTPSPSPTATPTAGPSATPGGAFLGNPATISQVDGGGPLGTEYYDGFLAFGADANLYIVDQRSQKIDVFDPATMSKVRQWPFVRAGSTMTIRPASITLGSDHRMWITSFDDNADIYALDTATGALQAFPYAPPTSNDIIVRLTAGGDGRLWGLSNTGLRAITPAGVQTAYPFASAQSHCKDIVLGNDGNVWFGCAGNIGKVTPAGVITLYGHGSASALTATADGIWYDSASNSLHLARIGYDGTGYIETPYTAYATVNTMLTGPDGNVYVGSTSGLWEIPIGAGGTIGAGRILIDYRNSLTPDYGAMVTGPDDHSIWSVNDTEITVRLTR